MILAIVLSALVLFGWNFLTESYFPTANPPATKTEKGRQVPVTDPRAGAVPTTPRANRDRALVLRESPRIAIRTPRLEGSVNLKGARIDDLVLTTHREGIGRNSPPIRLFSPEGAAHAYYGSFGWNRQDGVTPPPDAEWQASGTPQQVGGRPVLTPATPVTLSWTNGRGLIYQIVLRVDDGYLFTAEQRVANRSGAPVALSANARVNRVGVSTDPTSWTSHVGPVGVFNGSANYDSDFSDVAAAGGNGVRNQTAGGWLGFTDKYWLAAIVPDQSASVDAYFRHDPATDSYQADFSAPPSIVPPNRARQTISHLFAGAKEIGLLGRYSDQLGTDIERAIDWGWFDFIMKPIYALLAWLFALTGNFGVAIILLTVIVRLVLFPIAQKQYKSMAGMRAIQPKMKVLQERYADDKPRLQQEMMKLYKEEKVNPVAGCLPLLLQIPILYALYKVLMISVEMRHQPFALWIRDLSAPDPLTPVNLFGFLPFTPPGILAIGVLPILVGITMWMQMRLQPQAPDPIQRKIFAFMPVFLTFVMAPFAAGLQLYWVVGTILAIAQQTLLNRRYATPAPAAAAVVAPVALAKAPAKPAPRSGRKPRKR
jgi:YidC/Oxa1 family membrane protein insertase